jgi:hypothetical protein
MAAKTAVPQAPTPYDAILAWGSDNIGDGVPSPEVLEQAARALHAVHEFLVEPIAKALKQVSADVAEANSSPETIGSYPLPEAQRPVTYADIGRLIAWTDELRKDVGYLTDPIVNIALLAHEDLETIAAGYTPDDVLGQPSWNARMRRFHGLNEALGYA